MTTERTELDRLAETAAKDPRRLSPRDLRSLFRHNLLVIPSAGLASGYVQANLVVLPRDQAYDFLLFCQRNPKPCPLLEVTETGSPYTSWLAQNADLRTDLPRYRVFRHGELVDERTDIRSLWQRNLVAFLLGCSFTFEAELVEAGLPIRHLEEGHNVPMFVTSLQCRQAGIFQGAVVVTMRPFRPEQVPAATVITSNYSHVHGAPIHIGDPALIGVADLARPDFGEPSTVRPQETPLFWACGVTAQTVAMESRPPLMITHAPGHMFVGDRLNGEFVDV